MVEAAAAPISSERGGPKLTPNQRTMLALLQGAGATGLTTPEWNRLGRAAGIGTNRKATLRDVQKALQDKRLVSLEGEVWRVVDFGG